MNNLEINNSKTIINATFKDFNKTTNHNLKKPFFLLSFRNLNYEIICKKKIFFHNL